ncbi:MAG: hypothetical protein K2J31_05335 [Alistipes sp.]|nr:hypothetical protein [Alistipes sp.]
MQRVLTLFIFSILLSAIPFAVSAQPPAGERVELSESDSTAMAVLERYAVPALQTVDTWRPTMPAVKWRPIGEHDSRSMLPTSVSVRVELPRPIDMTRLVWKPSPSFSITVSNGSAGNSMPWPNSPIGYLDARTLSFPLPR